MEFKCLLIFPFSAIEINPVSSETTTTKASDISLIPIAALCLAPKILDIYSSFNGFGKKQEAATILFSLIIIAPS